MLLALLGACGGADTPHPRGLVLVVLDTVRADHLGYMGYDGARTPNIDALAARSWILADLNSPVPVTLPALSSLMTGRIPQHHGVHDNAGFVLDPSERTLAEALRERGYATAAVVASAVLSSDRGLDQGFDRYDDDFSTEYPVYRRDLRAVASELAGTRRRATEVTDRALETLEGFGDKPFFLLVHYFDAHSYYDPPPEFAMDGPTGAYDGEIAYIDHELGRLVNAVGALAHADDVVMALCADHGEGLGDHGESEHGFLLYQSTLHVPGLLAGPQIPSQEDDRPASLVDFTATLADLFEVSLADEVDGRSLRGAESTGRVLHAENLRTRLSYDWAPLFSLRQGSLKSIVGADRWESFDLEADAQELSPLSKPTASSESLRARLESWRESFEMPAILRESEARRATESDRAQALAALGYASVAPSPETQDLPHPSDALRRWEQRQHDKAQLRTAFMLFEERRWPEARALVDSLESRAPSADLFYLSCRIRAALGEGEASAKALEAALAADANHVPSLRELASRSIRAGRTADAVAALEQILTQLPDDPDTLYNLGVARWQSGEQTEARRLLGHFAEVAPQDSRTPRVRQLLDSTTEKPR